MFSPDVILCGWLGSKHQVTNFYNTSVRTDSWYHDALHLHLYLHLSINREGRWGTTNDFRTSFLHFCLFSTTLWDLPNSRPVHSLMLSSHFFLCLPCLLPPFHCALQDGFSQIWWTGHISIPLQFASLYDGQEVFVWFDCLQDLGTDFRVGTTTSNQNILPSQSQMAVSRQIV